MRSLTLHVAYDYVDPGSWLVQAALERWAGTREVDAIVDWLPMELRPPGSTPIDPGSAGWTALFRGLAPEAESIGLSLRAPPHVPWTRKAHELALHASEKGCFGTLHPTLFEAYFYRNLDIGRVDVLVGLAEEAGLDPSEARTVLGVDRFLPRVEALREELLREGVRGVPTVEAGDRRLEGLRSVDALEAFLDRALDAT